MTDNTAKVTGRSYRDRAKEKEAREKKKHILDWMSEHKSFVSKMDKLAFKVARGELGENVKFDSIMVGRMLYENDLQPDFKAVELLKVWRNSKTRIRRY